MMLVRLMVPPSATGNANKPALLEYRIPNTRASSSLDRGSFQINNENTRHVKYPPLAFHLISVY